MIHHVFWQFEVGGKNTAVIGDCLDQSHAGTIDTNSGAILTTGPDRNSIRGNVRRGDDGAWRVEAVISLTENPC